LPLPLVSPEDQLLIVIFTEPTPAIVLFKVGGIRIGEY
jgi:hypothetical protein